MKHPEAFHENERDTCRNCGSYIHARTNDNDDLEWFGADDTNTCPTSTVGHYSEFEYHIDTSDDKTYSADTDQREGK